MKKLYLLTVHRNQSFYVIAENFLQAQAKLEGLLNQAGWWFADDRKVKDIKLLAEEIHYSPASRPVFGNVLGDLVIVESADATK